MSFSYKQVSFFVLALFPMLINAMQEPTTGNPNSFTLLTSNVLMHSFYIGYSNNWIVDAADRIKSFNEEMTKAKAQEVDILCFQEWPYGNVTLDKNDPIKVVSHKPSLTSETGYYNQEIAATKKEYNEQTIKPFQEGMDSVIARHFPSTEYYHLKDPFKKDRDGVFLVISKKKFTILGVDQRTLYADNESFYDGKILLAAHLAFKNDPKKTIAVMTSHIPYNKFSAKNFALLKKTIDSFDADGKVLCGDFNFNTWDNTTKGLIAEPVNTLKNIFTGFRISTDDLPFPTAKNGSNNEPLLLDYVIYSNTMHPVKKVVVPEELKEGKLNRLLAHTTTTKPMNKMFYSDHAALIYAFNVI